LCRPASVRRRHRHPISARSRAYSKSLAISMCVTGSRVLQLSGGSPGEGTRSLRKNLSSPQRDWRQVDAASAAAPVGDMLISNLFRRVGIFPFPKSSLIPRREAVPESATASSVHALYAFFDLSSSASALSPSL